MQKLESLEIQRNKKTRGRCFFVARRQDGRGDYATNDFNASSTFMNVAVKTDLDKASWNVDFGFTGNQMLVPGGHMAVAPVGVGGEVPPFDTWQNILKLITELFNNSIVQWWWLTGEGSKTTNTPNNWIHNCPWLYHTMTVHNAPRENYYEINMELHVYPRLVDVANGDGSTIQTWVNSGMYYDQGITATKPGGYGPASIFPAPDYFVNMREIALLVSAPRFNHQRNTPYWDVLDEYLYDINMDGAVNMKEVAIVQKAYNYHNNPCALWDNRQINNPFTNPYIFW